MSAVMKSVPYIHRVLLGIALSSTIAIQQPCNALQAVHAISDSATTLAHTAARYAPASLPQVNSLTYTSFLDFSFTNLCIALFNMRYMISSLRESFTAPDARPTVQQFIRDHIHALGFDPNKLKIKITSDSSSPASYGFSTIFISEEFESRLFRKLNNIRSPFEQYMHDPLYNQSLLPATKFFIAHELGHAYFHHIALSIAFSLFLTFSTFIDTIDCAISFLPLPLQFPALVFSMRAFSSWFLRRHERAADLYACQHSTPDEQQAAADFFDNLNQQEMKFSENPLMHELIRSMWYDPAHPPHKERAKAIQNYMRTHPPAPAADAAQ